MAGPVPGQPAGRAGGRAASGVPRTITDAHVEEVVVRTLEEDPEGATDRSGDPPATPAGTRDPVPVPAGRRRRMQPASHDEDTGVVRSVLGYQGWHPNHHHGPRPHVKHIRTTGSSAARPPA